MHGIFRTLNSPVIDWGLLIYNGILSKSKVDLLNNNNNNKKVIIMSNYKKPQHIVGHHILKCFPKVSRPDLV